VILKENNAIEKVPGFNFAGVSKCGAGQNGKCASSRLSQPRGSPHNPVLQVFTASTVSQLFMANPGEPFEATDFISDSRVPQMSLIFAGTQDDRSFVHYEQGGRGHMFIVALFKLISSSEIKPIWRGYCTGPAHNLAELRYNVIISECR
jgi:hypothetical protein